MKKIFLFLILFLCLSFQYNETEQEDFLTGKDRRSWLSRETITLGENNSCDENYERFDFILEDHIGYQTICVNSKKVKLAFNWQVKCTKDQYPILNMIFKKVSVVPRSYLLIPLSKDEFKLRTQIRAEKEKIYYSQ